jgi:hypothetical protein
VADSRVPFDPPNPFSPSPWLDAYIAFSRRWSPRAYDGFHEACGLWVLSTVAARRVVAHLGGKRYTNLYLALTARSSLYGKSTTTRIALDVLRAAGLADLLAPDDATPQAFIHALSARLPENYASLNEMAQARVRAQLAWAGQRGWYYEEFGGKVAALMRENGFMSEFRGLLRRLDDCPPEYQYVTVGRGAVRVERPYLSLLASLTPADLRPYARRGAALWQDGFWARFAFVGPWEGTEVKTQRYPSGEREIPPELTVPLIEWHRRLGQAEAEVEERPGGGHALTLHPAPESECCLTPEVEDAFYAYADALLVATEQSDCPDLDGSYIRFAEKALRVALLLGSLENSGLVEPKHWQRAYLAAEGWRTALHAVYDQVNSAVMDEVRRDLEERLLTLVDRFGAVTAGDARPYVRGVSTKEVNAALMALTEAGVLVAQLTRQGTFRFVRHTEETVAAG